jgi:Rrf2 family protein
MRFSMKTEYGVRAVLELAGHAGRGALQSSEIARRQGIPGPFLDQVLMILRRAGFITSTRGPHGGHELARGPEEIRLDQVIDCLEGTGLKSRQPDGAQTGDSRVLGHVTEKAEQAARDHEVAQADESPQRADRLADLLRKLSRRDRKSVV